MGIDFLAGIMLYIPEPLARIINEIVGLSFITTIDSDEYPGKIMLILRQKMISRPTSK